MWVNENESLKQNTNQLNKTNEEYNPNDPSKLALFPKALKKFKISFKSIQYSLKDSIKFILLSTKIVYQPEWWDCKE